MKMHTIYKLSFVCFVFLLILILSACNMPWEPRATETAQASPPPTEAPWTLQTSEPGAEVPEPVLGSTMAWFDTSTFVYVPPGEFKMGQDEPQPSDHSPAHDVTLSGFWIHQTEVTNDQYRLCVDAGGCSAPVNEPDYPYWYADPKRGGDPVVGVDWNQAQAYCGWVEARLPTEAEWEKAARGDDSWRYPWGDPDPTCTYANYRDCLTPPEPFLAHAYLEGISPYMLLNTAGNVFEWTGDWYGEAYYGSSPFENPPGPDTGTQRVTRGGSFLSVATGLPVYLRSALEPEKHRADLGFRCVLVGPALTPFCMVPPVYPEYPQPEEKSVQASAIGYCDARENGDYVGFNMTITEALPSNAVVFDAITNNKGLMCFPINNDPYHLNCYGPPLAQNQTFSVEVCQLVMFDVPPLECPPDYVMDSVSYLCEYFATWQLEDYYCPMGYTEVVAGECWPIPDNGNCPSGFYYASGWCAPSDECLLPGAALKDPACQRCPNGSTFDPQTNCCQTDFQSMCPAGYFYEIENAWCVPYFWNWEKCTTLDVYIPVCEQPPPPVCTNPSQYDTPQSCEAANCKWVIPATGGPGYCE